ncbi:MAG TPA: carboxypeptidase regulatory-like domain-containing protein [Thermoanaerobaculia bacterium]|nr:carboxypeptidase regulatory-like domain-containing protein [Thermoanaerobaculia bacterium]
MIETAPPAARPRRLGLPVLPLLLLAAVSLAPHVAAAELRVVDPAGGALAGARVRAVLPPASSELIAAVRPRVVLSGESGEDGRIAGELPRIDGLTVLVDHPAHAPRVFEPAPAAVGGAIELRLLPGLLLAGTARPAASAPATDGAPAAAPAAPPLVGRACARWSEARLPWLPTTWVRCAPLAADGSFRLAGLPAGEVDLEVRADGFVPARLRAPTDRPATVRLDPGVLLTGRVTDLRDRPLAGATVRPLGGETGESAADGSFAVVAPALPVALEADARGHQPTEILVRAGKNGQPPSLHLHLLPGAELTAQVVAEGEPPAEVELRIERFEPPSRWSAEHRRLALGDGGTLRVELAHPGRYRLRVRAAGYRDAVVPELEVPVGRGTDLGAIALERGAGVAGWVSDADSGDPLPGVDVEAVPQGARLFEAVVAGLAPRATSGATGEFLLPGLAPGDWEIRFRRAGVAPAAVQVSLAGESVEDLGEVVLSPGVAVSGRVTDRAGNPRPGLAVRVYAGDGETWSALAESHCDADGRFEGLRLAPGPYRVRVEGERPLLTQGLELGPEERERELELVAGGVRLAGRVLRGGAPVAGGSLHLLASDDPGRHRGKLILHGAGTRSQTFGLPTTRAAGEVGPDGTFVLEDSPTGWVEVTVQPPAGAATVRRLHVPDRAEAWIEIDLEGETLAGRVVDADDGQPLEARVAVYLAGAPTPAAVAWSRVDGTFAADGLEPGAYSLEVTRDGYAPGRAPAVTLPAPGGVTVELAPSAGAGSLRVTLVDAGGRPLPAVATQLVDASGRSVRSLLSGPDGARRFDDLPAGTYRLVWADPAAGVGVSPPLQVDGESREARVVVEPGAPLLLGCAANACEGLRLDHLAVYSPQGLEVAAYLPGADAGLRLTAGQTVSLGRLAPGTWLVDLVAAGQRRQQRVVVASEPVLVPVL